MLHLAGFFFVRIVLGYTDPRTSTLQKLSVFRAENNLVPLPVSEQRTFQSTAQSFSAFNTFFFVTGIYYTTAIVGPAIGYVLGGQLLQIYTDFLTVDPTE